MTADSYPGMDGSSRATATRADIEATRARMGDTLEELGERLNPARLKQQAKDKVREATIGRVQIMANTTLNKATNAGQTLTSVVRDNPIPVALIAAGISWLVFNKRRSGSPASSPSSYSSSSSSGGAYDRQDSISYASDHGADSPYATDQNAGVTDKMRDKTGAALEGAQDAAQQVKEKAGQVATNVAQTTREQKDKVARTVEENPVPLGIIAAAIGLAAGFALPSTRKESELVGEKRDELVDKARDAVREKKEQAKNVAQRVVTEAKSVAAQAAREEGLTT